MAGFIIGTKSNQSQTFSTDGGRIPTTFIMTSPCYLIGLRWTDKHGYFSVKLGFGNTKNIKKSIQGQITKAGVKTPLRFLREVRLEKFANTKFIEDAGKVGIAINDQKLFIGAEINPTILFKPGDLVDVSGVSKGKGFQGAVKLHHFRGGPRTHGQSHGERAPGSIGSTTTPGRVYRGKRMAGHMGDKRVTVRNLKVVEVRNDGIVVKGHVPGGRSGLLEIRNYS